MSNQTPTADPASPPGFVAWVRQRAGRSAGKWCPVATGRTEREASDRLFARLAGTAGHADTIVLPSGEQP